MRVFVMNQRIEFGHCDPAGLLYYPHYYRWFDHATHRMFNSVGYFHQQLKEEHGWLAWPLIDTGASFKSPGFMGDDIEIRSSIVHWSGRTFRISHTVWRGDEQMVDGFELRFLGEPVPGNPRKLRAVEIPREMRQRFD